MNEREAIGKMTAMLERVREYLADTPDVNCCCGFCDDGPGHEADALRGDINSLLSRVPGPRL